MTRIRTIHGTERTLGSSEVERLRETIGGAILSPDDDGYDATRAVWNGMIDRRPSLIVRAAGAADASTTVRFAREREALISVRGGGHNIAGTAVADDALMLDLSALRGIHVDPRAGTTRVEPGCLWGEVDRETQPFGLAVPSGIVSTTGVAGLTLGGGFGWNSRRYGYTSDNLLSADVVTADGERLRASADENKDLFWALRGGGGNFGVVTSFEFRAQPVGPEVLGGMILWPMERAREVAELFRSFTEQAPDEMTALLVLRKAPPAPALPEDIHGRPVAIIALCHTGPVDEGERLVRPLRNFAEPLADLVGRKPFMGIQTMLDAGAPHGRLYYWKSDYFAALSDAAADAMVTHAERITSPQSAVLFMHLGGAANRLPADHSAAGPRDIRYVLNIQGAWPDPAESERHIAWVSAFWEDLHPHSAGRAYMNFFTADEGRERLRAAYDEATLARLGATKARFDPGNLFRLNQNIEPSAWSSAEETSAASPA